MFCAINMQSSFQGKESIFTCVCVCASIVQLAELSRQKQLKQNQPHNLYGESSDYFVLCEIQKENIPGDRIGQCSRDRIFEETEWANALDPTITQLEEGKDINSKW